jgi:hypothetical protein
MVGTLSLLLRKAGEIAEESTKQVTPIDLANGSTPKRPGGYVTVVVTRPSKDATSLDEYSVPVERGNAGSAALSRPTLARE